MYYMTNKIFSEENKKFINDCRTVQKKLKLKTRLSTMRQASKYRNKKGLVYKVVNKLMD